MIIKPDKIQGERNILIRINWMVAVVLAGLGCAVLFHYFAASLWRAPWPLNIYLFAPDDRFNDLINSVNKTIGLDPYHNRARGVAAYFPFTYMLLSWINDVNPRVYVSAFTIFCVAFAMINSVWYVRLAMRRESDLKLVIFVLSTLIIFCSYPFQFAVDRGNLDAVMGLLCMAGMLALWRGWFWGAAMLITCAAAWKAYPVMFILLFVRQRRYWQSAFIVVMAILLNFLALLNFVGEWQYNWCGFQQGLTDFHLQYVIGNGSRQYCADPYNASKIIAALWASSTGKIPSLMSICISQYQWFSLIILIFCSIYYLLARSTWARRLTALVTGMIIYPNVINDYKLVYYLIPLAAYIVEKRTWGKRDIVIVTCMLMLMVPKNYYFFGRSDVSISCLVSALILMTLTACVLVDRKAWGMPFAKLKRKLWWYSRPFWMLAKNRK